MYRVLRFFLFLLDPESVHNSLRIVKLVFPILRFMRPSFPKSLARVVDGVVFPSPIGVAAGFDKNGELLPIFPWLGFGFVEIGTVTLFPQRGKPRPRILRYPRYRSLQNWMGFPSAGANKVVENLKSYSSPIPIGVNIGTNWDRPKKELFLEHRILVNKFKGIADFFVINFSSPNTRGLRDLLEDLNFLVELFKVVKDSTYKPVYLKISPDMKDDALREVVEVVLSSSCNGIVATNTTSKTWLIPEAPARGGLSGRVLRSMSLRSLELVNRYIHNRKTVVSVGGIEDAEDVKSRLEKGAQLCELFTSIVYEGPSVGRKIIRGLL